MIGVQSCALPILSMEIHDTTVQNLTTLIQQTEYVGMLLDRDVIEAKLELNTMNSILRKSINELREIIYNLRPMSFDDLGLVPSLQQYIAQIQVDEPDIDIRLNITKEETENILTELGRAHV